MIVNEVKYAFDKCIFNHRQSCYERDVEHEKIINFFIQYQLNVLVFGVHFDFFVGEMLY
jgi:hypothetical protein